MSDSTRRGFLKTTGVVAAGVTVGGAVAAQSAEAQTAAPTLPDRASGSLVAHVPDVRSGEVVFMVEGHEVTVTDPDLVARMASAMHSASRAASKAGLSSTSRPV